MPDESNATPTTATADGASGGTTQQATTGTTQQNATADASATGVPVAYVWKGADGKDVYAPETVAQIEPVARELGMTQEQAMKFAGVLQRFNDDDAKSTAQALEDRKKTWEAEVRNDPKMGGANYDSTIRNVGALLDKLGVSEDDKAFFKATGIGMHPSMVRLLHGVHERTKEDSFNVKTDVPAQRKSDSEVFWPSNK